MADEPTTITVKAEWMAACGFPAVDTVLPVTRVQPMHGKERMYHVEHNGRPWAVWSIRCVQPTIPEEGSDMLRPITNEQNEALKARCEAFETAWQAGQVYANTLQVGDVFRGSMGEARHRGLEGDAMRGFHLGAWEALQSVKLWTRHDDSTITKLER